MDVLQHACVGAVVTGGGLTAAQSLMARKLKPPSSLALSAGSFVGIFRLLEATGRKLKTRRGRRAVEASEAAAVAAAVALFLLDEERRTVLVSYAVVEAALKLVQKYTKIADVKYIDIPLGALAAGPLIDSWIYKSDAIARSQLAALDSLCQLSPVVLRRMRDEIPSGTLTSRCDVFHRGQSCAQFHATYFADSMRFAARLYVPIYALSVLAPKYKRWIWGPRPPVMPLVVRYLRTCCCLTMLYQVPLGFSCASPSQRHRATVMTAGALTTLAFLAEHEHRRGNVMKAVGVYTTGTIAARAAGALGLPRRAVQLTQVALVSMAMAVVFHRASPSSRTMRMLYGYSNEDLAVSTNDSKDAKDD